MPREKRCPNCGEVIQTYRNPVPTVDIIIHYGKGIVLIKRKNPPLGWALPGGFVDYGETLENSALREAHEETGLELKGLTQFRAYSDPKRDPRHHSISMVFTAMASGVPKARDDAKSAKLFSPNKLPAPLCFDHAKIISDYTSIIKN